MTSFGESHGPVIGVVLDGIPAGLPLDLNKVQAQLDRRRPGQSSLTTARSEGDQVECLSGLFEGLCTGAPLALVIPNKDARPQDYEHLSNLIRPSHADFTVMARYGLRDHRGGGRSSARETAARVMAGAVAEQLLEHFGIRCYAWVHSVGPHSIQVHHSAAKVHNHESAGYDAYCECPFSLDQIEKSPVRCPDPQCSALMVAYIDELRMKGDSTGGTVVGWCQGLPAGLGDPVFDKLEADLAKAMLSINAAKAFESGSGMAMSEGRASEFNDAVQSADTGTWSTLQTLTNHSGGIQGGISNGQPVWFKVGFKAPATIARDQQTVDIHGNPVILQAKGRHDPCVVPRAVAVVEAMTAMVIADHLIGRPGAQLASLIRSLPQP
jgi:chorismate synthase